MRLKFGMLAAFALISVGAAIPSQAVTITALAPGVLTPGGPVETFDSAAVGPNGGFNSVILGAEVTGGSFVTGSTGNNAAPYFGPARDTTVYTTVGPSGGQPMTFAFSADQKQFGLYFGSIDDYNSFVFSLNNVVVATVAGSDIASATGLTANGGQDSDASARYIVFSGIVFDSVAELSTQNALEADNYSSVAQTPLPGALPLMASGLGAMGMVLARRKRRHNLKA